MCELIGAYVCRDASTEWVVPSVYTAGNFCASLLCLRYVSVVIKSTGFSPRLIKLLRLLNDHGFSPGVKFRAFIFWYGQQLICCKENK